MELQLNKIIVIAFVLFVFNACSKNYTIKGDWEAIESDGTYAELYFSDDKIQIHHEVGGTLQFQTYRIENDTLITSILKYKMNWINADSLNLISPTFSLKLKRIKTGLKLSECNNEKDEDAYMKNFFDRMYTQKGLDSKPVGQPNFNQKIEEEIIEIGKKK